MRRVVVTGIGIVSPLGNTVDTLWNALMENRSGVRVMPEWREYFGMDCVNAPVSVTEDEIRSINRKIRRTMGNAALYACIASKEAVAQSTLDPEIFQSGRVGCVVGSTVGSASSMMEACAAEAAGQRDKLSSCHFFRLMSHSACFNLSEMYGINGIQLAPCSACASGLQSIGTAQEMIRLGKADVVLAGGTDESTTLVASSFQLLYALAENGAEHPETVAKPFDADRSGLVCGEGAGILVLEEYEHAVRRNADILFEIAGYATNCSGHHASRSDER